MGKVLQFKRGVETPLGLTHHKLNNIDEVNFYDIFKVFRYLKLSYKKPSLDNRKDIIVKSEKYNEFLHYAWELDIIDIFYFQNIRPFNNEDLNKIIPKLKRVGKDIKDIYELMYQDLLSQSDSRPKRTLGNMQPQSMREKLTETLNARTMFMYLIQQAEGDIKVEKGSRPREVLSIIYPVQLLTKIWNCLDEKRDLKQFIVQEIFNISSLKDLKYITIQNAMKKAKGKAFEDQYLRSVNSKEELEKTRDYIFKNNL